MSASKLGCWVTGMVIVEATAKTNSVTISEGIRLDVFLSSSFRSAPSRDYIKIVLAMGPANREMAYAPQCWDTGSKHQVSPRDGSANLIHHQDHPLRHS